MFFKQFFDKKLAQYSYLIGCQATGEAIIIDPMRITSPYFRTAESENLTISAAADTHIHADYVTGLRECAEMGLTVYASGEGGPDWQYEWLKSSSLSYRLLHDGDTINVGNVTIKAWFTPGHTPEHLSFFVTDGSVTDEPGGLLTGDFIFVGDVGRPDLLESAAGNIGNMEPSARRLYESIRKFTTVPDDLLIWPGHGAGSACGKSLGAVPVSTVGYERKTNRSLNAASDEKGFIDYILSGQPEPPLYFAEMKRLNRTGPPLLNGIPDPVHYKVNSIVDITGSDTMTVLDTRPAEEYIKAHLSGSLLTPFNRQFNTAAGSYLDSGSDICLVIDHNDLEEAITDLLHIGRDSIKGYLTPGDLIEFTRLGGKLEKLEVGNFDSVDDCITNSDCLVLDVRNATEFEKAHIRNAVNLPWTRLPSHKDDIPRDKKLVLHCQTGQRSAVASAWLQKQGYDVLTINDDFNRYISGGKNLSGI